MAGSNHVRPAVSQYVKADTPNAALGRDVLTAGTVPAWPGGRPGAVPGPAAADAAAAVTGLYQGHAVGLIRLALVMLGDRPAAEDIVQDAFTGLYRRWAHLTDPGKAPAYLRSATINGCRNELRRGGPGGGPVSRSPTPRPPNRRARRGGAPRGAGRAAAAARPPA